MSRNLSCWSLKASLAGLFISAFDHAFLKNKNTDFECVTYNCNICNFFSAIAPKKNIDVLTNMMLQTVRAIYANEPYAKLKTRVEDLLDYIMKYFDDVGHSFFR